MMQRYYHLIDTPMTIREEIRAAIKKTLASDDCSSQCLDTAPDRTRVLTAIMTTIDAIAPTHANLYNALASELD